MSGLRLRRMPLGHVCLTKNKPTARLMSRTFCFYFFLSLALFSLSAALTRNLCRTVNFTTNYKLNIENRRRTFFAYYLSITFEQVLLCISIQPETMIQIQLINIFFLSADIIWSSKPSTALRYPSLIKIVRSTWVWVFFLSFVLISVFPASGNDIMELQVYAIIAIVFLVSLCSLLFINKQLRGGKTFEDVLAEKRQFAEKLYGNSGGKNFNKKNPKKLNEKNNKKVSVENDEWFDTFICWMLNVVWSAWCDRLLIVCFAFFHCRTRIVPITTKRSRRRAPSIRKPMRKAIAVRVMTAILHQRPTTNCTWNLLRPKLSPPMTLSSARCLLYLITFRLDFVWIGIVLRVCRIDRRHPKIDICQAVDSDWKAVSSLFVMQ